MGWPCGLGVDQCGRGLTGSLGPCGGGGVAGMVVGSQWRSWAARVYRAAVMMWWACPSRTMWRSAPKSFGRWAAGWTVMWARTRWWAFFPPSGACVRLSPGMCSCWCFGGGSEGEGFYTVEGDGVFPGPAGQDVYARVSCYGAQVHVARDGGGRQPFGAGARCMGWSRAGHGAHIGGGRCCTG